MIIAYIFFNSKLFYFLFIIIEINFKKFNDLLILLIIHSIYLEAYF